MEKKGQDVQLLDAALKKICAEKYGDIAINCVDCASDYCLPFLFLRKILIKNFSIDSIPFKSLKA
jgi:hypothetical protein